MPYAAIQETEEITAKGGACEAERRGAIRQDTVPGGGARAAGHRRAGAGGWSAFDHGGGKRLWRTRNHLDPDGPPPEFPMIRLRHLIEAASKATKLVEIVGEAAKHISVRPNP